MEAWLDGLADALGVERLSEEQIEQLLGIARDVAHGVERKATPLATFLLGAAAERAGFDEALAGLRGSLPPADNPDA